MDFPVVVGPLEKGRRILDSFNSVQRPDFFQFEGPTCAKCGTILSDDITERMDVHSIKYCPVCVLEDIHPNADPKRLVEIESLQQLRNIILDTFGSPPERSKTEGEPLPGAYTLWCPPLPEEHLANQAGLLNRLGNLYVQIAGASNGNGLIYVGQSQNVASRVWSQIRGEGALVTTFMPPSRLVAVDWKLPNMGYEKLENEVGRQVTDAIQAKGYDIEVYWN